MHQADGAALEERANGMTSEQGMQLLEPDSSADEVEVTRWGLHAIKQSQTQLGRQQLLQLGATSLLPAVLSQLSAAYSTTADALLTDKITWTLRLLRNICAAGESACLAFLDQGVVPSVLSLLAKVHETGNCDEKLGVLSKTCLQLLVNMTASSPACLQRIWDNICPDLLVALSQDLTESTAEPLCNLILQATKSSKSRAEQLCHGPAAAVLSSLLSYVSTAQQPSSAASTLSLIVHHVVWQLGLLRPAMISLAVLQSKSASARLEGKVHSAVCREHVTLLQLLADELEQPTANRSTDATDPAASTCFLICWVHSICASLAQQHHAKAEMVSESLEAGLQVLRALTAQDAASEVYSEDNATMPMLVVTLAMLTALNPIQPPRRPTAADQEHSAASSIASDTTPTKGPSPSLRSSHTAATQQPEHQNNCDLDSQQLSIQLQHMPEEGVRQNPSPQESFLHANGHQQAMHQTSAPTDRSIKSDADQSIDFQQQQYDISDLPTDQLLNRMHAESPEQLASLSQRYPKQPPYKGYRCDLVALLANLCYRQQAVQQKVQQLGCVELVLSQCQWDDDNPLVREYGLWAVRNLCEGNEEVQQSISGLRACSTVDNPDLERMGMKLQLDGQIGKPKLVARHP